MRRKKVLKKGCQEEVKEFLDGVSNVQSYGGLLCLGIENQLVGAGEAKDWG